MIGRLLGIGLALLPSAALATEVPAPLVPTYVEETATANVDQVFSGDWEYMVGGGVASFDCNGDLKPDLFVSGGAGPSGFFVNRSKTGGALAFERTASGLEFDKVLGAYPIDVDGDGNVDLVLLRQGENVVMRGLGGCHFERANEAWGFDGGNAWSAAFAATFEKGRNWPTFAVGNYIDIDKEFEPWGSCTDNWLHRPDGKERKFAPPLALKPSFCPLSMIFTDWNRSGTPALRISNDREYYEGGQEQLWRMPPDGEPTLYTEADGWAYVRIWGMGIAAYDLDGDGYQDYFLTSMADSRLQVLARTPPGDRPAYKEIAFSRGVTAHRPYTGTDLRPSTGWHSQFEDVNNDGRVDLFIVKGNVDKMPDFAEADPNNLLLQRADGTFVEAGDKAGIASMKTGRGGLVVDLNLDGLMDIVVVNRRETAQLWRNTTEGAGHFVAMRLTQDGPNRDAIGALVEFRQGDKVFSREVTVGGGHAGGHLGFVHVGLGAETAATVRITWPDGKVDPWLSLAGDGFYEVARGAAPRRLDVGQP